MRGFVACRTTERRESPIPRAMPSEREKKIVERKIRDMRKSSG